MAALTSLGEFFVWLLKWVPRRQLILEYERGVKMTPPARGWFEKSFRFILLFEWVKWLFRCKSQEVVALESGCWWYWPLFTEIRTWPVVRQTLNIPPQTLTTVDGCTVVVSGTVVYDIDDIVKILVHTYDPEDTIREAAALAVCNIVTSRSFEDLKTDLEMKKGPRSMSVLNEELTLSAKRVLQEFGVRTIRAFVSDYCEAKSLRVWGGMNVGEIFPVDSEVE